MPPNKRPTNEKILKIIKNHHGYITHAAKAMNVSRVTLWRWIDADSELQQALVDQNEANIDFAESQLKKRMEGFTVEQKSETINPDGSKITSVKEVYYPPDNTSLIFYLKTKGKQRGYSQSIDVNHNLDDERSPEEIEKRIAELSAKLLDK